MNQLELNKARAEVMLGARYDEYGRCINVEFSIRNAFDWKIHESPVWEWNSFSYRLIPKSAEIRYKPYSKVDESWINKVVRNKRTGCISTIMTIDTSHRGLYLPDGDGISSLPQLFDQYIWLDGTPFGEVDNG